MRLLILENRHLRNTLRAGSGILKIGSDPTCEVCLPDGRISAHQATLSLDDDGDWWLEIADPTVTTSLNRAIQKNRAKIRHADEIELGPFCIRCFMESDISREEMRRRRMQAISRSYDGQMPLGTILMSCRDQLEVAPHYLEQASLLVVRLAQVDRMIDALPIVLRGLLGLFNAKRAWVGVRHADSHAVEWELSLCQKGTPRDRPVYVGTVEPRCMQHGQSVCVPSVPTAGIGSAMAVPLAGETGNLGFVYIENDEGDPAADQAALHALVGVVSCLTMPIENILRKTVAKRQQAVQTEQQIARAAQDAVTPRSVPQWKELEIAALRHMGDQRCCDFYDVVQLRDRTAAIVVARIDMDALAATRCFGEIRASFRSSALYSEPPHLYMRAANWILHGDDRPRRIDVVTAWVNPTSGQVQYCIAGTGVHVGRIAANGECEKFKPPPAEPMGATRSPTYNLYAAQLAPGDALAVVTNGVRTAINKKGEYFGLRGLEDNLCDGVGEALGQVLSELHEDMLEFIEGGGCADDVTVVLVRRVDAG